MRVHLTVWLTTLFAAASLAAEEPIPSPDVEPGTRSAPPGVAQGAYEDMGPPNCDFPRGGLRTPPGVRVAAAGDGPVGDVVLPTQGRRPITATTRRPTVKIVGPRVACD